MTRQPGPDDDPQLQALTSLVGWRQFASEVPAVPGLLDSKAWQELDPGKRAAYDDDRIAHHSRLLVVQTPAGPAVVTQTTHAPRVPADCTTTFLLRDDRVVSWRFEGVGCGAPR